MANRARDEVHISRGWSALSLAAMLLAAPSHATEPAWTHELPMGACVPSAPGGSCITTQPLDLRRVTKFRLSVQAINFGIRIPQEPAVIRLRDANNLAAPCFGATCPTTQIPFGSPALGSCCSPTVVSPVIGIPVSQRRPNVRLRLDVTGGNFVFGNAQPPVVQFYED